MNNFYVPSFFIRKCKYAIILYGWQTDQSAGIVASDEAVRQVQMLEVVDVGFGIDDHNHSVA